MAQRRADLVRLVGPGVLILGLRTFGRTQAARPLEIF